MTDDSQHTQHCPNCGAKQTSKLDLPTGAPVEFYCGTWLHSSTPVESAVCQEVVRLRHERDHAVVHAYDNGRRDGECNAARYRSERDEAVAVLDVVTAWADGIPASNWRVVSEIPGVVTIPPSTERWNAMIRAIDTYLGARHA